ncbi:HdeD family acid-resistance protein [Chelativorans sp. AA-79]|uniref:HdeD family acid-resistance protein n=1 Tax=Chelativorans sp. AA-79 TaxID=3028735 RepID=UPI0023FA2FF3|nr:HdeD family acid-resistance protein [Chelativorans sp. AA-79]WEX10751.1 HdeD family acid-resistance protein [Chelativorans sp. AA-79]
MTTYDSGSSAALYAPPTWLRVLLGIVLIVGGIFVLGDVALATLVSTLFIGITAIVVGAFEIIHAFWTKGWGGFVWQILLGVLYIVFGWMVVSQPVSGALILTFALGLVFLASGIVRIVVAFKHWSEAGWLMLLSGVFGILAGFIILSGWPASTIWVLGLLLGIDLITHGVAWLTYGWLPASRTA